jgi:FKBP-type peptidyl-prolyl cis-trans isomerase
MLLDGTVFNKMPNPESPKPFTFRLGRGAVIDGWDQGLKLMREGGKMLLIVPFELGYGTRGNPPAVPRQATLVFEIEMQKIERSTPLPPEPEKESKRKTNKYDAAPFTKKTN